MSLQVIYATRLHMQRDQLSFISAAMSSLSWWTALLLKLWAKINPPYVLSKKKKCKTCACHHSFCGCLQWARHGHHPAFHIFSYHSPAFNFFLPPLSGSSREDGSLIQVTHSQMSTQCYLCQGLWPGLSLCINPLQKQSFSG